MQPPPFNVEAETARLRLERGKLTQHAVAAHNTVKGYSYDWGMFEVFCRRMKLDPLPATSETVSLYLTWLMSEGKKTTTASRRAAAIASMHRERGFASPVTLESRALLRGARRLRGERTREMIPLSVEYLRAIAGVLTKDGRPRAIRNRAILVTGFASALRRSNLVALNMDDLEFTDGGVVLQVRKEKNDQAGRGRMIGLPRGQHAETCPVRCLEAWIAWRRDFGRRQGHGDRGVLFTHVNGAPGRGLHPETIEQIVKASVQKIGLPCELYAAHSLRAGMITEAGIRGLGELNIAVISGHRNMTVLRKYFRKSNLWRENPSGMIGL